MLPTELPEDLRPGSLCFSHHHEMPLSAVELRKLEASAQRLVVSANVIVGDDVDIIDVDSTSGNVTVTLPPAINHRRLILVRRVAANTVTLAAAGADQIDGVASITIAGAWGTATLLALPGMWVTL